MKMAIPGFLEIRIKINLQKLLKQTGFTFSLLYKSLLYNIVCENFIFKFEMQELARTHL